MKRTNDVLLHRGAIVRLVMRLRDRGGLKRWDADESIDHAMALAFELMARYYDPQRGNVTTFLYRVLPARLLRLYLLEHGRGEKDLRPQVFNRQVERVCHDTPLSRAVDGEQAERIRAEARAVMDDMTNSAVAAWARCGRRRAAAAVGCSPSMVSNAVNIYRQSRDLPSGKTLPSWTGP